MTVKGSGRAKSAMRSIRPRGAARSTSSAAIPRTLPSSSPIRFGVKARPTSPRSRAWTGSSAPTMVEDRTRKDRGIGSPPKKGEGTPEPRRSLEKRGSFSIAATSA